MLKKIRSSYSVFHKDYPSRCPLQFFSFLLPEALEGNKKEKRFPLPSGLDKTYSISDNYFIGSPSEQHFAFELALEFELVIPPK